MDNSDADSRFSTVVKEEKSNDTRAIDFGESVLCWLPPGVAPAFCSFRDEPLFSEYALECANKIKGTNFTLNEMLSLKLYADTTLRCAGPFGRAPISSDASTCFTHCPSPL